LIGSELDDVSIKNVNLTTINLDGHADKLLDFDIEVQPVYLSNGLHEFDIAFYDEAQLTALIDGHP
jgi:hypothetical protein